LGALLWGAALAAYILVPTQHLQKGFSGVIPFPDPYKYAYLSPFSMLLSPCPILDPGVMASAAPPHFTCAIGFLFLLAWGFALAVLFGYERLKVPASKPVWAACAILFAVACFGACSPTDFWVHLPQTLSCIQFPYRILTYSSLFGALLCGLTMTHFLSDQPRAVDRLLAAIAFVIVAANPWIQITARQVPIDFKARLAEPGMVGGYFGFLFHPDIDSPQEAQRIIPSNKVSLRVANTVKKFSKEGQDLKALLNLKEKAIVQCPMLYYPGLERAEVNGQAIPYYASLVDADYNGLVLSYALITLPLEAGLNHIRLQFNGDEQANHISLWAWILTGVACLGLFLAGTRTIFSGGTGSRRRY
jgi:hypothetical protein